jgi:zinc transporter 1/2/3
LFSIVSHTFILPHVDLELNISFRLETFEGLGLGSRLAFLKVPQKYNFVPLLGAIIYGFTTPLGIAVGLGVRTTYNPGTATASIVSGVMDAFSSGILIYTGLVEVSTQSLQF